MCQSQGDTRVFRIGASSTSGRCTYELAHTNSYYYGMSDALETLYIEDISSLWERGFVWYNELLKNDPDTLAGLEQTLAFEKGSRVHEDAPDAEEGAIYILQKHTRVEEFKAKIGRTRPSSKYQW